MIAIGLALLFAILQDGNAAAPQPTPIRPSLWLVEADYPAEAFKRHEQGVVFFTLDVDVRGRVSNCTVTTSSGSPSLDAETCTIVAKRGRFKPARDGGGNAVPSTWSSRFAWTIPR
ncbi:MAG: energy transducer TonB [Sphingomonas sp.]|uniref:energy transducer TonB n=1 Tax=Sphingomonas sp. TaxID=28214 RepID=UPI0025E952D6|nr:energy transducer TonB [Sphingomonas sp.]MBX3566244.1 energy transducer TonB [Sphingomonas sp.]